ncbi:phosphatidylinositol-specific phospholipase C [Photorhabdus sp. APURE]|uniref:phosphatidylinositol-specific phospholipase C n=1 Tax=Photorhabdus aballayi TaxID=2991723 RepID=UPI00223CB6BA|nr:phosphatidylinositol-specific phospholipase C [Photorhabdus aballayi]MCW7548055.1 phosphatidylinositol-specific phospholipase C [Photorhabdus aballayi]
MDNNRNNIDEKLNINHQTENSLSGWAPNAWMGRLHDDNRLLSHITIPGTHESCAHRNISGMVQCQDLSISDQLQLGIRYLDIRCHAETNNRGFIIDGYEGRWIFDIHHGIINEYIIFDKVINDCENFLKANPLETILMSIKQEQSKEPDELFNAIFKRYKDKYSPLFHDDCQIPKLGDVRGKIVIISRNKGLPGIAWTSMDIEDHYDNPGKKEKYHLVVNHLEKALKDSGDTLYLTNTSAYSGPDFTLDYAFYMNKSLKNWLIHTYQPAYSGYDKPTLGIVAMDFVGRWNNGDVVSLLYEGCNSNKMPDCSSSN